MKMSEYAALHQNDGQSVDVENIVKASSLVGETVEFVDLVYIEKTKFDNSAYLIKISDGTGFFTTASLTRQIDKFIKAGVSIDALTGCWFKIISKHLDEGEGRRACDFLQFEFVRDGEEAEAEE